MPVAPPKVVIFVANHGNDPTEVAVPWSELKAAGCIVTFATEHGEIASADPVLLQQSFFACVFGASSAAKNTYKAMLASVEHQHPLSWSDNGFDILEYGWFAPSSPPNPESRFFVLRCFLPHNPLTNTTTQIL